MQARISPDLDQARLLLEKGELVAIPTETVYGLAGNGLDENAVARIFAVKNRPYFDPLILHIGLLDQLEDLVELVPHSLDMLSRVCWPGPLTLLLPRTPKIPDLVTSGLPRVAVRMPAHPIALDLLRGLDFPLAAPSANPFGYISPTRPEHVARQLGEQISFILDGGVCQVGIESTIIGLEGEDLVIYRPGGLTPERLCELFPGKVRYAYPEGTSQAPGNLPSHYAPRKTLYLVSKYDFKNPPVPGKAALLCFKEEWENWDNAIQWVLSPVGDMEEAARRLFSCLREMDESDADYIAAEILPDLGLGIAVNDRLRRAAKK